MRTLPEWRPASFRGVPFACLLHPEHGGGRRNVEHEIIDGKGFLEDTGVLLHNHTVSAVVSGEGFEDVATRLEAALDAPGPGAFVHPTLGTVSVAVNSWSAIVKRGAVEYTLDLNESGTPVDFAPSEVPDVSSWSDQFTDALADKFGATFNVIDGIADVAADAIQQVNDAAAAVLDAARRYASPTVFGAVVQQAHNLTATAVATVRTPSQLAANWTGVAVAMAQAGQRACIDAVSAIPLPTLPDEPTRTQSNAYAHASFVRGLMASSACEALVGSIPANYDEAAAALDATTTLIGLVGQQSNDRIIWRQAADLRDATLRIVGDAAVNLPHLRTYEPPQLVSVFEVSQLLFGDGRAVADILARNGIANPLWLSAPLRYVEEAANG